jgi:hypothetical protein
VPDFNVPRCSLISTCVDLQSPVCASRKCDCNHVGVTCKTMTTSPTMTTRTWKFDVSGLLSSTVGLEVTRPTTTPSTSATSVPIVVASLTSHTDKTTASSDQSPTRQPTNTDRPSSSSSFTTMTTVVDNNTADKSPSVTAPELPTQSDSTPKKPTDTVAQGSLCVRVVQLRMVPTTRFAVLCSIVACTKRRRLSDVGDRHHRARVLAVAGAGVAAAATRAQASQLATDKQRNFVSLSICCIAHRFDFFCVCVCVCVCVCEATGC